MKTRALLVPVAMFVALASVFFNVANADTLANDTGPDLDAGFPETGMPDGFTFDSGMPDATTCTDNFGQVCGSPGGPGCAGGGGAPGSGGQGGAATVGLLAIGSTTVSVTNGAFVIGHGGTGGPGGMGQSGGIGDAGAAGASATCYSGNCPSCMPSSQITGGTGGSGTNGGAGGQGGGGAGGPAYDYVEVGGATVNIVTQSTLASSVTGLPGAGGAPNGVTADAGVHP